MKFHIEQAEYCPCVAEKFFINTIKAQTYDFGEGNDEWKPEMPKPEDWFEDACCLCYTWKRKPSTPEILNKYYISEEEYQEICTQLEKLLSVGCCGCCI